jgi:cytochrome b561
VSADAEFGAVAFRVRPVVPTRYGTLAIALHWAIAALIAWNLVLGFLMHNAKGLAQFNLFQLHKSVGISVLLLSLVRLLWRLTHRPPPLPDAMSRWERLLARATHSALYLIMIGMPITGWVVVSTSPLNIPTLLFHTIPWPHLPVHDLPAAAQARVNAGFGTAHMLLAWSGLFLIALHVAGALKHAFLTRDGVFQNMLPFAGGVHRERDSFR